ncbi:hypothetical protein TWF718_002116 [Orbilia javanica]|uniref:Uncharacterized protein n=1 Tax=Orbilia javanica TaxID=47235 RepID=A0AAN8MMU8_9PEZI
MQRKLVLAFLSLLSAAVIRADEVTIQEPITGCEGNAYCTGFEKCTEKGYCHRRESCGTWAGLQNTCCYATNASQTCAEVGGDFLINTFNFASVGTEPVYAKKCPQGTGGVSFDYLKDAFACCPLDSLDIILQAAPQNASFLEPGIPRSEQIAEITAARCVGTGFSDSGSSPSPSTTEGTSTGTQTSAPTGTSSPNSARPNNIPPAIFGISFFVLALGFV